MFDWDEGNIGKNLSHGVQDWEIEEACEDAQARVIDYQWIRGEWRSILLGERALLENTCVLFTHCDTTPMAKN